MFNSYTANLGREEVKKLTKVTIFFIAFFMVTVAYAFAAYIGYRIPPFSEPVNLLILGIGMVAAGHCFKLLVNK